jgi:tyrosyl-tRNA synthetase
MDQAMKHKISEVYQIIRRDCVSIIHEDEFFNKLMSGKKLKIKLGADPSRPDLHLGHSVVLRKLKLLQELGHEIMFVIGDFTGMIGDPSGKSKTRKPLSFEETRKNGETYLKQVTKILDPQLTTITYNSEWLSLLNFAQVLQLAGKYTVARILERDDFSQRFYAQESIGMHELFYPLMQGYDSVALCADVEIGGTDQTFNLLVGRELQRDYGMEPQCVLTFPLLIGLDGVEKMSKSLDNYIGIDEAPEIMYEKCMKIQDHLLEDYFRLTTDISPVEFKEWIKTDIREAHKHYASTIVTLYWGEEAAIASMQRYNRVATGNIPIELESVDLEQSEIPLIDLLVRVGFADSKSEARRLIRGLGVKINHTVVKDEMCILSKKMIEEQFPPSETTSDNGFVISKGKNRFIRCELN